MKSHKNEPISTIPDGVYEGGTTPQNDKNKTQKPSDITTDIQKNGYPIKNNQ